MVCSFNYLAHLLSLECVLHGFKMVLAFSLHILDSRGVMGFFSWFIFLFPEGFGSKLGGLTKISKIPKGWEWRWFKL